MSRSWPRLISLGLMPLLAVASGLIFFRNILLTFCLYHILVCLIVPSMHILRLKENIAEIFTPGGSPLQGLVWGAVSGALLFLVIFLFFLFTGPVFLSKENISGYLSSVGYDGRMFVRLAVYFIFFNSVVEELFWRGFIYGHFRKALGPGPSAAWVSFFFVQYHFLTVWLIFSPYAALLFTPFLFAASAFWCFLREKTGSVYGVIVSHLLADLAVMAVYYRLVLS